MKTLFLFRKTYFILTVLLFITEVLIAIYVRDKVIRPYIGDYLVVILLYSFVRSFLNMSVWVTGISVLLFSYLIEILQYFRIVEVLGLEYSRVASIVIRSSFEWMDLVAYTAGFLTIMCVEKAIG